MSTSPVAKLLGMGFLAYRCPACKETHGIQVDGFVNPLTGAKWTWNQDPLKPTVTPSVNVWPNGPRRCHHFIRDGQIEYCGDCQHEMAGQTVDLPPWELTDD